MKAPPTIAQICAAAHNEESHSRHVARLAGAIFRGVAAVLNIPRPDRRLLATAARLHDIGYASNPADHAAAGARSLLRHGVNGLCRADVRRVAAIILLHQKQYRAKLRHPLLSGIPDVPRCLRLAAILRVADGLDHGHLQNTAVQSIVPAPVGFRIRLAGETRCPNTPYAAAKSDLWLDRWPYSPPIFERADPPRGASVLEAARILLLEQHAVAVSAAEGAVSRDDPECLHDLRGALRRFRAALRLFRGPLAPALTTSLARRLATLNRRLGPIRDHDVWRARLQALPPDAFKAPALAAYLRHLDHSHEGDRIRLLSVLRGRAFRLLLENMMDLACRDLPAIMIATPHRPLPPFACAKLRRLGRRISRAVGRPHELSPEALHDLRKLCRRGRYWTEFLAPAFPARARVLHSRFRRMADALGRVHDADVAAGHLRQLALPPGILGEVRRDRHAAWAEFEKESRIVRRRTFRRHLRGLLG